MKLLKNKKDNTNWGQSVTGVVIKENKVLLARHTYGGGKGMLIIPGGYVNIGETPRNYNPHHSNCYNADFLKYLFIQYYLTTF